MTDRPEQPRDQGDEPDVTIDPLQPPDTEVSADVADRLAEWRAREKAERVGRAADGDAALRTPSTLEERLAYQRALRQARLANLLGGLGVRPDEKEESRSYGVSTSRDLAVQEEQELAHALANASPDEQEDILMQYNRDWRAWLTKHGTHDIDRHREDLQQFRISTNRIIDNAEFAEEMHGTFRLSDKIPELTEAEERLDYWRWLASSFAMNAADLAEGISLGLIGDPVALQVLGSIELQAARDRMNSDIIGPDTAEQGEITSRAHETFQAIERVLTPLINGTRDDSAAYCAGVANQMRAASSPADESVLECATRWDNMALRLTA